MINATNYSTYCTSHHLASQGSIDGRPAVYARDLLRQFSPASPHTGIDGRSASPAVTAQLQQHLSHYTASPANQPVSNLAPSWASIVRDSMGPSLLPPPPAATVTTTSAKFISCYSVRTLVMNGFNGSVSINHSAGHQNIIISCCLPAASMAANVSACKTLPSPCQCNPAASAAHRSTAATASIHRVISSYIISSCTISPSKTANVTSTSFTSCCTTVS